MAASQGQNREQIKDGDKNENKNDNKNKSKSKSVRIPISMSTPALSALSPNKAKIAKSAKKLNAKLTANEALKLYRTVPSYRLLIRDIIKADISIMEKKSFLLCPHRHHCVQNAFMKGFWRTFAAAFVFKTSLALFTALFSGKIINKKGISWSLIKKIYLSRDSLLFANIFALMSFTYKVLLCMLRRWRLKDPIYHKTIAGFICGIWILLDGHQRRNTIALYCIVRAISDAVRLGVTYKRLPTIPNFDVATFTASQVIIMFGAIKDPKGLDPKYYKWILNMGNLSENAIQTALRSPSGAMYRLPNEKFVECCPVWHDHPSCIIFNIKDWFKALIRAGKMYFPVHFLPTLLLSPKSIIKAPMEFLKKKSWNTIISACFLATYVFNMRYTVCFLRNIVKDDPAWIAMFGGFMAGLSLIIENPRRRPELMLYCLPRALEWILKRVSKDKLPKLWKLLRTSITSTIAFQIAVALWLTIWNIPKGIKNSNSINMTVMNIVFGSKH